MFATRRLPSIISSSKTLGRLYLPSTRAATASFEPSFSHANGYLQTPSASLGSVRTIILSRQSRSARQRLMRAKAAQDRKPTLDSASQMPRSPSEMDNASLVTLAQLGHHPARTEVLRRHIMVSDGVDYQQAGLIMAAIEAKNREFMYLLGLPYQIGIGLGMTAAVASIPLVFDLNTASWFNTHFVTTEVPEEADLETVLEVGSWTWNWMEPILGQISFFLLCLQYSRAQLANLGVKPYTAAIKQWRGERLAEAFEQYDSRLVIAFSESAPIYKKP